MSTDLDPTQLAIEFLRRDKTELSPAQYLKRLKQLELEFADLLTLLAPVRSRKIFVGISDVTNWGIDTAAVLLTSSVVNIDGMCTKALASSPSI